MPAMPAISQPAYRRVEKALRADIRSGRWGAMLPSRQTLAAQYSVSLGTIERAVIGLIADGTLSASNRRGTFVNHAASPTAPGAALAASAPAAKLLAKASEPPSLADAQNGHARLGIIAHYLPSAMQSTEHLAYWVRQAAQALTSAYLKPGEESTFHNLHSDANGNPDRIVDAVRQLKEQGVNTIVILDVHNHTPTSHLTELASGPVGKGVHIVYVSSKDVDSPLPHIWFSSAHVGRQAAVYCLQCGFRSFTFVSPIEVFWARERFDAIQAAATEFGLPPGAVNAFWLEPALEDRIHSGPEQRLAGLECGRSIFGSKDFPRCLIALNDFTAYGIMEAAKERHLAAGRDFSLVSFDDAPYSLPNGLTTFRPPLDEAGEEAARMLKRIERGEPSEIQVRLRWSLVVRSSSQCTASEWG